MTIDERMATFDARWRVIQERINRSIGQHARHAHRAIRERVERARREVQR